MPHPLTRIARRAMLFSVILAGCDIQPATQALDSADLLYEGWAAFRLGEFEMAQSRFERLSQATEESQRVPGLYGLGLTWSLKRPGADVEKGRRYLREVAEAPSHPLAPWGALAHARTFLLTNGEMTVDRERLISEYEKVIQRFPGTDAAQEAVIHQQATRLASSDPARRQEICDTVILSMEHFLQHYPDSRWQSAAHQLLSVAYARRLDSKKSFQHSVVQMEKMETDPGNPKEDKSGFLWSHAVRAEFDLGDFALARAYYNRLIAEYPRDERIWGAHLALSRMERIEKNLKEKGEAVIEEINAWMMEPMPWPNTPAVLENAHAKK